MLSSESTLHHDHDHQQQGNTVESSPSSVAESARAVEEDVPVSRSQSKNSKTLRQQRKRRRRRESNNVDKQDQEAKKRTQENDTSLEQEKGRKRTKRSPKQQQQQEKQKPLSGMVLSISTFSEERNNNKRSYGERQLLQEENAEAPNNSALLSFHSVSSQCQSLGATVTSQISKRVQLLITTSSAINQATQRVRKAYKRQIPIVSIDWLHACNYDKKKNGSTGEVWIPPPIDDYLIDISTIQEAIQKHQKSSTSSSGNTYNSKTTKKEKSSTETQDFDDDDIGWSEPKDLGCCCVCHENGSEQDCKWCIGLDCCK